MARATGAVLLGFAGQVGARLGAAPAKLRAAGVTFEFEPLVPPEKGSKRGAEVGLRGGRAVTWHLARASGGADVSPWDAVREVAAKATIGGVRASSAEPDLLQEWRFPRREPSKTGLREKGFTDQDSGGGKATVPGVFAWHLGDNYSGLAAARALARAAGGGNVIRIAHLDTGYDLDHAVFPRGRFDAALSRNFTGDGRAEDDVRDKIEAGTMRNPGHGTGTLGILTGGSFKFNESGYEFEGEIGAAPDARIVGLRVASSVVQIKTSAVARAIAYAASLCADEQTRVHVLSMSMGGVASDAWADAVNQAYEQGIVLVTAAGNNYSAGILGGVPTTSTVYPARFGRVLAACGVMANFDPYYGLNTGTMQGNWGPSSKEETSLAAFTPNTPWARRGEANIVDMDGAGTSSATPQIAGAAALYLQRYAAELFDTSKYPEPWMRVEAVRHALLATARADVGTKALEKLGAGMLRAAQALERAPVDRASLRMTPVDKVSFPFWHVLTGLGAQAGGDRMLELELAQLVQQWESGPSNPFDAILREADGRFGQLTSERRRELLDLLSRHPLASEYCKRTLRGAVDGGAGKGTGKRAGGDGPAKPALPSAFTEPAKFVPSAPKHRDLRGYAMDPSFAISLATESVSETVFSVPWEPTTPGPCDEYLEVIDIDPASNCVYEPVWLDHPHILAQSGLAPSEGTPQFHQQMTYAVARLTIDHFERALGRRVLWRPGKRDGAQEHDDSVYVPRLRIYPHALRDANAFYSPDKIALLFGYFGAEPASGDTGVSGERVFTCLSHDIVAHETTHALLDGMHRRYLSDSNPDVLAFHEAFADIVALFQRLAQPDLLKHQIASTRGEIRSRRSLLGQLATQFGRAVGHRGALREAIGSVDETGQWKASEPNTADYQAETEPHARGSVLVAAVFDAFISMYEKRTQDLVRIATEGTGELRPGAIHPDLVARLAAEASKTSGHVLNMCIRALDYCPPTDITFGEYLRAIITADYDIIPDDDRGYRVAFVEAFRKRGITVSNVRTMGVESLLWRQAGNAEEGLSKETLERLAELRQDAVGLAFVQDREEIFKLQRGLRKKLHGELRKRFSAPKTGAADAQYLGLDPSKNFEVHSARFAMRVAPNGRLLSQAIFGLLQRDHVRRVGEDPFEGGSTVIADLAAGQVKYVIRKNVLSAGRLGAQREYAAQLAARDGAAAYFRAVETGEPFAALHKPTGGC